MEKSILKLVFNSQLSDLFAQDTSKQVKRTLNLADHVNEPEITVLSGVRRCGKSSLLETFLKSFHQRNRMLYLNFEDPRLIGFTGSDFLKLYEIWSEDEAHDGPRLACFDEVQNVEGWEPWMNFFSRQKKFKVYITGSNSTLLSSELATHLTGRIRQFSLYPLSFQEVSAQLKNELAIDLSNLTDEDTLKFLQLQKKFLKLGGFPRAWLSADISIVQEYYENILNRDILRRRKIRNPLAIERLGSVLMGNIGRKINKTKLTTSIGTKNADTTEKYIRFFEECFLGYEVRKFDLSVRKQLRNQTKFYAIDHALASRIGVPTDSMDTFLFENMVFVELKRRNSKIYYWQSPKGYELDFVVETDYNQRILIQVCWSLENEETLKRELRGFHEFQSDNSNIKVHKKIIITWDMRQTVLESDIHVIPFYQWALQPSSC
jgi:uncharacterized protein